MRACNGLNPPDITSSSGRASSSCKRVVDWVFIVVFHYHIAHRGETLTGNFIEGGEENVGDLVSQTFHSTAFAKLDKSVCCFARNKPIDGGFLQPDTVSVMALLLLQCRLEVQEFNQCQRGTLGLRSMADISLS